MKKYNSALLDSPDQASPAEIIIIKHRPEQPWFTSELRILKRNKRILERSYKKTKSEISFKEYTKQKKCYKAIKFSAIKQTRCYYYTRVLNLHQNNPKFFFSTIQKLSGDIKPNVLPSDFTNKALAEAFSKFFDEKITSIYSTVN